MTRRRLVQAAATVAAAGLGAVLLVAFANPLVGVAAEAPPDPGLNQSSRQ